MPSILCITLLLVYIAASASKADIIENEGTTEGYKPDETAVLLEEEEDDDAWEDGDTIYCEEELFEFTAVIASGKYLLVYDPEDAPCSNIVVEKKKKRQWICMECVPAYRGWNWFRNFNPGEENEFRIFDSIGNDVALHKTMFFLSETPPPVTKVETKVGLGFVTVYITAPKEPGLSLLGYRVSLLDLERSKQWQVVGEFENVVYGCAFPKLMPVHPCLDGETTHVFCAVFSDLVWWTNNNSRITNETMKYIQVETFRIPTEPTERIYSIGFKHPLYTLEVPADPTESAGAGAGAENGSGASRRRDAEVSTWEDQAWVIFLALTLALLAGVLPVVHYLAVRDGRNDARNDWNEQKCGHNPFSKCLTNCLNCCCLNIISYTGNERLRLRGFKRKIPHPVPDRVPKTESESESEPEPEPEPEPE